MELFFVAIILNPTKKQVDEEGSSPVVIVQPTAVLAKNEQQAGMKAARLIPEEHANKEDRLEVRILPFRKANA
jgi:hypothetical protein